MSRTLLLLLCAALPACATLGSVTDPGPLSAGVASTVPDRMPADLPPEVLATVDPVRADGFSSLFDDPQLAAYLRDALAANTDIAAARANVSASEARLRQARAARLPRLSASGSSGLSTFVSDPDIGDSASAGLSVGYDADLFGGIRASIRGAEAREALARAELARLRRVVLARTAQSYVEVIASESQLALARENFEFLGETLRVSRARFEGGDIARADFALAEAEYENARAGLFAQEAGVREARRALASLLGAYADAALPVAASLPSVSAAGLGLPDTVQTRVLARNDVEAARLSLVASVADVDATRAATLPDLRLGGGVSGGLGVADLLDIDTYVAALSATIADTLFDGGADAARIDTAQAGVDAALARYADRAREAYRELVAGFDRAAVFQRRLDALDTASAAAETALELEGIRYDLGEAILLDVLTVQRRVNSIRADRIRAQSGYLQAVADAYLAAGPA